VCVRLHSKKEYGMKENLDQEMERRDRGDAVSRRLEKERRRISSESARQRPDDRQASEHSESAERRRRAGSIQLARERKDFPLASMSTSGILIRLITSATRRRLLRVSSRSRCQSS